MRSDTLQSWFFRGGSAPWINAITCFRNDGGGYRTSETLCRPHWCLAAIPELYSFSWLMWWPLCSQTGNNTGCQLCWMWDGGHVPAFIPADRTGLSGGSWGLSAGAHQGNAGGSQVIQDVAHCSDLHPPQLAGSWVAPGGMYQTQGSRLLELSCLSSPCVHLSEPAQLSVFCAVLDTKDKDHCWAEGNHPCSGINIWGLQVYQWG